ncbi:MAG: hypothetical protein WC261_08485 [Synergistaceae bacterium]|jgi:hypothetical protein
MTELEMTAEDITLGMQNERTVTLKSANPQYDGKIVRVRTLRGGEFRKITSKVRVLGSNDLGGGFAMAFEACKTGIVTPGISDRLDDLDEDIILKIGQEILSASKPAEEAVEDFSTARKGSSSS